MTLTFFFNSVRGCVTNKEICLVRIVFAYAYSVVLYCSLGY